MSNSRRQIEAWLKTIDVKGSVLDVGGLFWPVKGRTKTWNVSDYVILDTKPSRNGVTANIVHDLNRPYPLVAAFDNAFLVEVTDHLWDPMTAFQNINNLMRVGGMLHVSSNFLFPHHTGFDCLRLTSTGLTKLLQETKFDVLDVSPRFAVDNTLEEAMWKESKVVYHPGEIGYFVTAKKYGHL